MNFMLPRADCCDFTVSSKSICLLFIATVMSLGGCREKAPVSFEPNLVQAWKYVVKDNLPMEQASKDVTWAIHRMYGTPDDPKLPESIASDEGLASLVKMENLVRASGDESQAGRGLYRKHCVICHGVTGNGRGGQTSVVLVPYPRDYRMGVYKFKSTRRGSKPTRDDLTRLIKGGIPGTAMKVIPELTDADVQALVDYVIYLSWRGELERRLLDDAGMELDLTTERVFNTEWENSSNSEEKSKFQEQWDIANEYVAEIGTAWLEAEDRVVEVPDAPESIPMADSHADFVQLATGDQASALAESVKRGREVFIGKFATCSKCHGEQGLGNGQTTDYDDWTKDWTVRVGLKPEDRAGLVPLMARGALPPLNALPRNLADGMFHGGDRASDLYRRIVVGIDGTPMPSATFVDGEFTSDDVWHLINFIRSLQKIEEDPQT
jgi:mono/diheme cytochrome c family protein